MAKKSKSVSGKCDYSYKCKMSGSKSSCVYKYKCPPEKKTKTNPKKKIRTKSRTNPRKKNRTRAKK